MNNDGQTPKPRRKKATRACSHCQKAHLTCDDSRPCQRCIKRGLESTCTDGTRKRAKYLQDDEYEQVSSPASTTPSEHPSLNAFDQHQQQPTDIGFDPQLLNIAGNYGFGSESANLEYGILSNMLQLNNAGGGGVEQFLGAAQTPGPGRQGTQPFDPNTAESSMLMRGTVSSPSTSSAVDTPSSSMLTPTMSTAPLFPQQQQQSQQQQPLQHQSLMSQPLQQQQQRQMPPQMQMHQQSSPIDVKGKIVKRRKGVGNTPEEAYTIIKGPFNYAEGYHYLFQHVRQRMGREDLMRISRALAIFRPSFISAMIHLTEEDLIYMEKCVQRTLLEYEKLITFSGTPTAVWRRTGEIVLVGKEFSLLTQWSKETLLGKKTFIYELMDNGSAVEYWEKYAQHAFSDTESSAYMSVILMSPTYRPVPCSICFTIKRDFFDLPSVVVGNFLPMLNGNTL
ncbi:hypothetical protein BDB00DRAFT_838972 [Zychaea mexicana]|uniref:uncharacterized protein n=1 Tax=Zychaea mexicana TaxID=64656 RepID=UPI0022FDE806|nr:uncharacterized protein BDB00DRAFT_838972 [Zychaea mexicana]KAI9490257.1 hypothetical protein BDB00DRAFT_838972 [Zychaea mexicana]